MVAAEATTPNGDVSREVIREQVVEEVEAAAAANEGGSEAESSGSSSRDKTDSLQRTADGRLAMVIEDEQQQRAEAENRKLTRKERRQLKREAKEAKKARAKEDATRGFIGSVYSDRGGEVPDIAEVHETTPPPKPLRTHSNPPSDERIDFRMQQAAPPKESAKDPDGIIISGDQIKIAVVQELRSHHSGSEHSDVESGSGVIVTAGTPVYGVLPTEQAVTTPAPHEASDSPILPPPKITSVAEAVSVLTKPNDQYISEVFSTFAKRIKEKHRLEERSISVESAPPPGPMQMESIEELDEENEAEEEEERERVPPTRTESISESSRTKRSEMRRRQREEMEMRVKGGRKAEEDSPPVDDAPPPPPVPGPDYPEEEHPEPEAAPRKKHKKKKRAKRAIEPEPATETPQEFYDEEELSRLMAEEAERQQRKKERRERRETRRREKEEERRRLEEIEAQIEELSDGGGDHIKVSRKRSGVGRRQNRVSDI